MNSAQLLAHLLKQYNSIFHERRRVQAQIRKRINNPVVRKYRVKVVDETLQAMEKLALCYQHEPSTFAEIQAAIEVRKAELKVANTSPAQYRVQNGTVKLKAREQALTNKKKDLKRTLQTLSKYQELKVVFGNGSHYDTDRPYFVYVGNTKYKVKDFIEHNEFERIVFG